MKINEIEPRRLPLTGMLKTKCEANLTGVYFWRNEKQNQSHQHIHITLQPRNFWFVFSTGRENTKKQTSVTWPTNVSSIIEFNLF